MDINPDEIELTFFDMGIKELNIGTGYSIYTQGGSGPAGRYHGLNERNKYHLSLDISRLKIPEMLVSVIAHELSHVKLIDQLKLEKADEFNTDLVPLYYGLGIFSANSSFQFHKDFSSWGYSAQGYLSQMAWGYALALYAYVRKENTPDWINFLIPNIKADFKQAEKFIYENEGIIFQQAYDPNNY